MVTKDHLKVEVAERIDQAKVSHDWQLVKLGDIAYETSDRVDNPSQSGFECFVGLEHLESGNLTVNRWGNTEDVTSAMKLFKQGDTLFARRNAYLKRASMVTFDGVCSGDAIVLRENREMVVEGFLPLILNTDDLWNYAIANAAGSMSKRVKWRNLAEYKFALPPKDEQRRIADILWAADEVILKTKFLQEQIQSYKQTLMQSLFDPHMLEREGKSSKLVPLAEVVTYASDGPFGSKLKTEHYTSEGVRVIRLQNIGEGSFEDADKAYISNSYYHDLIRYTVKPGDIIVAGLGDEAHALGRACLIPKDLGISVNKADCFCLRANTSIIDQEYLLFFLNSLYARNQVNQLVQGTTRARINVSNLKSIMAIVPDRESQAKVCHILKSLETTYAEVLSNIQIKRNLAVKLREHLLSVKGQINV